MVLFRNVCIALSLLLVCVGGIHAAPLIHKCVAANGIASYQTLACARHDEQAWSREVSTAPASPATIPVVAGQAADSAIEEARPRDDAIRKSKRARATTRKEARRRPRLSGTAQAAVIPLNPKGATPACLAAQRKREATLARAGLTRSYAMLAKLDEDVHRACY
ncbi:hypothetical protein SAMN06296058_0058 [Pseudoxanthomonas indica]|uniref:DUF4124 domain-containing protein n=2 Tax=Pseudoxanthomonas indica TaxID=428993 RepID=A0A1T5ILQ8_9GAMM|nr:hypothetical protein SAMN06296058_0058 [Pseudoxanthomonas indica]